MAFSSTSFLLFFFLFIITSPSYASPSSLSSAVEVLSDSGYFSMGLTLQLANSDLNLDDWQELTIFAPTDQAFSRFGQPSLLDIKYQLSPARLPGETLRNLPLGAKIPTLKPNFSLTVTNSSRFGGKPSINNVVVQDSPVFDDGYVVIYGTDEFFTEPKISDPFLNSPPSSSIHSPTISPPPSIPIPSSATTGTAFPPPPSRPLPNGSSKPANRFNIFESASSLLMSRGFVIMATFLALQLDTSENSDTRVTVFAPVDDALPNPAATFSDYVTILRGHVIQRLLSWKDLQNLAWEGSILPTALKGCEIELSWSGDILLINGVPLVVPDLYVDERVAVHGVNQMIAPQADQAKEGEGSSEPNKGEDEVHGEYSSELGDYGLH